MPKYKCGHETDGVIVMDSNILSTTAYIQWAEEENNLKTKEECFDCYLKKLNTKEDQNEISQCKGCHCMTKTIKGKCGKCKAVKGDNHGKEKKQ